MYMCMLQLRMNKVIWFWFCCTPSYHLFSVKTPNSVLAVLFWPSFLHLFFNSFCSFPHFVSLSLSLAFFSLLSILHSPPISSPSLFLFLLQSLRLLKISNKQTSSGWLASHIYNSSQSNCSKYFWQTHEVDLSASRKRERERKREYVLPPWPGLDTQDEYPSIQLKD